MNMAVTGFLTIFQKSPMYSELGSSRRNRKIPYFVSSFRVEHEGIPDKAREKEKNA